MILTHLHLLLPGDGSYRGGTWVLHLKEEHSSKPLQLYASSSFAPLLSNSQSDPAAQQQQQAGQPAHTLVGTRLRLPGALAQPQRVVGRSRHGPQTATRPYLPTRAIMIEVDESDSGVWARDELSNHPTLGRAEFSRVFDLEQSQQVVSAIATQVRACIDGKLHALATTVQEPRDCLPGTLMLKCKPLSWWCRVAGGGGGR